MARRLLLVGWDAADWRLLHPLLDAGQLPALRRLVEGGASGPLLGTQPLVPAAQWTSLATGKRPWQHQVCHPLEWNPGAHRALPVTAARRRARALWELLAQAGKRSLVVGWPATHGAQSPHVVSVSDRYAEPTAGPGLTPWPPAVPGTYWPEALGARLDGWRVSPAEVQADIIARCLPEWQRIDQKRDRRLGQLRLFLAADFSHQAALMTLLASQPWDCAAIRFPALGAISQLFLDYCAPRPHWVSEAEGALYQQVIPGTYQLLDQMLDKLIRAVGPDTAVLLVSVHGVARRTTPPPRAGEEDNWKSPQGIFAAWGPGFSADALVLGATVLDVAPTVLSWFGLPLGDDLEGRVLLESFATPLEVAQVPGWETGARPSPGAATAVSTAAPEPTAASAQLGLAAPGDGRVPEAALDGAELQAVAALRREWEWNLAQSFLEAGRWEEALPLLAGLFRTFPERPDLAHALFQCQLVLRQFPAAADTLEVMLEGLPAGIGSLLPQAELALARGNWEQARAWVAQARALAPTHPEALRRLGWLLLRLRDWAALEALAQQALAQDDHDALAWLGLAEAQLRQQRAAEAEQAARRALAANYYLWQAHFVLARALVAQGKWQPALQTMRILSQLQPQSRSAAAYYRKRLEQQAPR